MLLSFMKGTSHSHKLSKQDINSYTSKDMFYSVWKGYSGEVVMALRWASTIKPSLPSTCFPWFWGWQEVATSLLGGRAVLWKNNSQLIFKVVLTPINYTSMQHIWWPFNSFKRAKLIQIWILIICIIYSLANLCTPCHLFFKLCI